MPSRTGMLLAARGRGPAGDPFLGAIARLAFGGIKAVGRLGRRAVGRGRKVASGALVRSPQTGALVRRPVVTRVLRGAAGALGLGAAFEAGSAALGALIDPATGLPMKKRRQINPLNPRAARRAVSRLCRLQHFTDRLEHSLKDLVTGRHHHGHHRPHRRK